MTPPPFRRILVAVDASPLSQAATDLACRLSKRWQTPVDAVFVEDINIVRLVAHPFVHTISLAAARRQSADDTLIGKALELQAIAARRALDAALATTGGHGTFTVRRGRVEAEVLEAGQGCDLLCLGWSGRSDSRARRSRLGSVARAVSRSAAASVLLLQNPLTGPLFLWWDGFPPALEMAAALAARDGGTVQVVVPAQDRIDGTRRGVEAVSALQELGVTAALHAVGRPATLPGTLPADALLLLSAEAEIVLDDLPCSALLVR